MPELPEVETVRRTLLPHLVGRRLERVTVREARLRAPVDVLQLRRLVQNRCVLGVRRRAKYLLCDLEGASILMLHLGMTGTLGVVGADRPLLKHDHVLWDLDDGRQLRFNDSRRFGMVTAFAGSREATHPRLVDLGVEPLTQAFGGDAMYEASRRCRQPIKSFLMDARRVVGVGNIYASEALFAASIHPARAAGRISRRRWSDLVCAVRDTLVGAIEQGGTTLRDFANVEGEAGYFSVRLRVYGLEGQPCHRCRAPIRRILQAGRSTFYCAACQR
jgi:formamidopyrimidine-DNA glycosylase